MSTPVSTMACRNSGLSESKSTISCMKIAERGVLAIDAVGELAIGATSAVGHGELVMDTAGHDALVVGQEELARDAVGHVGLAIGAVEPGAVDAPAAEHDDPAVGAAEIHTQTSDRPDEKR